MSTGLAETGGFETQTSEIESPPAEIDYSLIERRLAEDLANREPEAIVLLEAMMGGSDATLKSIALAACPELLRLALADGSFSDEQLDALRNIWRRAMQDADEDVRYEAQEVFVFEQDRLARSDTTTHIWLKDAVTVEWFD